MAKKYLLSNEPETLNFIIGIAGMLKDFRLTYHLNKSLYLNLVKKDDLFADIRQNGQNSAFPFFIYEEPHSFLTFNLIGNKSPEGYLLPEFKQADYLLLINGPFPKESMERFLKSIRSIPSVLTAYKIDINKYKKLESFLTEIELHNISVKTGLRM